MTRDPLYEPLGTRPPQPRRWFGASPLLISSVAVAAIATIAAGAVLLTPGKVDNSAVAIAPIEPAAKAEVQPTAPVPVNQTASVAPDIGTPNGTVEANGDTVEVQHGVKIIRMGGARRAGMLSVPVLDPSSIALPATPDPLMIEKSGFGDLPRIAPNGTRPVDAYRRPGPASSDKVGAPRLAILVGGLAIDKTLTDAAIRQLPPAVSLAFRPDAADLPTQAARARDAGHETLLDFPGGAPSRHDAVSFRPAVETAAPDPLPEIHRMMGRFTGYVGVVGQDGSGVVGQPETARHVLRDIASRGLLFVDTVTAAQDHGALPPGLEFARADVVIDGRLARDSVDAALAQLESVARSNGRALGYVDQLSASTEAVARFASSLEARGIVLVPVSALARAASEADSQRPQ